MVGVPKELDPKLWNGWRKMIQGDRLEIAEYDLTAKVSQGTLLVTSPEWLKV